MSPPCECKRTLDHCLFLGSIIVVATLCKPVDVHVGWGTVSTFDQEKEKLHCKATLICRPVFANAHAGVSRGDFVVPRNESKRSLEGGVYLTVRVPISWYVRPPEAVVPDPACEVVAKMALIPTLPTSF